MPADSSLMYTCSLIEYIGRKTHQRRGDVVHALGVERVARIYHHACVLHAEPIAEVANEYTHMAGMEMGGYDNVAACRYEVPDYWTIGEVFQRLIEDVTEGDVVDTIMAVYGSWMADAISDYNSDLFYQPRDYLRECYLANEVLVA